MKTKKIKFLGMFLVVFIAIGMVGFGNFFAEESTKITLVKSHKATYEDIERLKQLEGVYEEGVNYNVIIDGHGTGLRPPTEEGWAAMIGQANVVENIQLTIDAAPASVDNSATNWFPPIGDQDGEGSCVCFAVGYYTKTFQEAKDHNWDLSGALWEGGYYGHPTPAYQDRIMSPDFIYHQINDGVDTGSYYSDAMELVCDIGASSWEKMPYNPADHTTWPSEAAWREAPLYRGVGGYSYVWTYPPYNPTGIDTLKNWLADENLAIISINANYYPSLTANDVWTLDNYTPSGTNHANTIVGYDDNFGPYTESGNPNTYGAFKVANSWGVGSWENIPDGFYWISYEAMKYSVQYYFFYSDKIDYDPETIAVFKITHAKRNELSYSDGNVTVGKGSTSSPTQTKSLVSWINFDGGPYPFPNNNIVLDITEFSPINEDIFLQIYDGGTTTTGTLNSFSVEFYDTYDPSGATGKVITSLDPPKNTVQGTNIYATCDMIPVLLVTPTSHDFGTMNEGDTDSWSFDITNTCGGTLTWNISESLSWVTSVDPASGTTVAETDSVTVDIDTTGLTPGQHYDGNISVTSDGGNQDVYVEVTVGGELPSVTWTKVWSCETNTFIHNGGSVSVGNKIRIYTRVSSDATSVQIAYGPSGNLGALQPATYYSAKDYWYVDWNIPLDATLGAYDAQVIATNANGDTIKDYLSYFNVVEPS